MPSAIRAIFQRLWRRPSRGRFAADHGLGGLLFAGLSLAVPFLLLLFAVAGISVGALRYFSHGAAMAKMDGRASAPPNGQQSSQQSDLYRQAAIVFVPWTGVERCEKRRFDNETGQIIYDGTAACHFPPPAEDQTQNTQLRLSGEKTATAAERMRAIHEAFKK